MSKLASLLVRRSLRGSAGAFAVRNALGNTARTSKAVRIPKQYKYVINWGSTEPLEVAPQTVILNNPGAVKNAVNKITALQMLQRSEVRVPHFRTEVPAEGRGVWLARTLVRGSGGRGIVVVREGEQFPDARLYVRYVPKLLEVRVHTAFGRAIFAQYKRKQIAAEQTKDQRLIRSHDNGWIFTPRPLEAMPAGLLDEAVKATEALGLHFGAVDLIIGKADNLPYVLEVNTAPGLESPGAVEAYRQAFEEHTQ